TDRGLTVLAVERREYEERLRDAEGEPVERVEHSETGRTIVYRAYERVVSRGIVLFRWDMVDGSANLHVMQATSQYSYDEAEARFRALVAGAIPFDRFERRDLRRAIRKLYDQEADGAGEARSHRYR